MAGVPGQPFTQSAVAAWQQAVRLAIVAKRQVWSFLIATVALIDRTAVPRLVTAAVHDGVLRVVVFRGGKAIAWQAIPLQGADAPFGEALRSALRDLRPGRHRLAVAPPLLSVLARSYSLPRMSRTYLDTVIGTEVGESIPFERGEIDLSWQAHKTTIGLRILATATPKEVSDRLFAPLRGVGLRPRHAYPQDLALCLITGVREGTVVWVDHTTAAIVRVSEGVPVATAEHRLATGDAPAESLARAITQIAASGPIHVASVAEASALADAVRRRLGAASWTPDAQHASPVLPHDFLVNAGMALARGAGRGAQHRLLAPNLVPPRHLPWRLPTQPIAAFVGLGLLTISALNLAPAVDDAEARLSPLHSQVQALTRETRGRSLDLRRIAVLQKERVEVRGFAEAIEGYIASTGNRQSLLRGRLGTVTAYQAIAGVRLASIEEAADHFLLAGLGASYDDVLGYASYLHATRQFSSVAVLDMAKAEQATQAGQQSQFTVRFRIRAAIVSDPVAD